MAGRPKKKSKPDRSVKRPSRQRAAGKKGARRATARRAATARPTAKPAKKAAKKPSRNARRLPELDRARRRLEEQVPTPPSSLNMNRRPSAARSGRAEMADSAEKHRGMSQDISGGDVDVNVEDAY